MVRDQRDGHQLGLAIREVMNKFYFPGVKYLGHIPSDDRVIVSARNRSPFISGDGARQTAESLERVAGRIKELAGDALKNKQLTLV